MSRQRNLRTFSAAAALLLGLAVTAATQTASMSFSRYFAVGDSLTAGFSNNSLVETHQRNSYPALIARQAVIQDFQQPLIAQPGIPPEFTLLGLIPVSIVPKAATSGSPENLGLPRPYNNLGVPGTTSVDALTRTTDGGGFHDLILRGMGTQVAVAAASHPTFITLWIGNNDVLAAAIRGKAIDGVTLTPPSVFRTVYAQIVSTLKSTGATIVTADIPDVTVIPFVTTIKPFVVDPATGQPVLVNGQPVPLIGPNGPVPSGSFITLAAASLLASGVGIPTGIPGGLGTPLPDEVILDPAKIAAIRDHVRADNQAISDVAQAAGIPVVPVNALFTEVATKGRNVGGVTLTGAFLTGGVFGYDGVHPTDLGYAVIANEWIRVINANGGSLPEIDLASFMGLGVQSAARRPTPTPWVEFTEEAYRRLLLAFPTVERQ